jgi:two-component system response regulator CpxR
MLDKTDVCYMLIIGPTSETGHLKEYLQSDGYVVQAIADSERGIELILSGKYKLAIFDLPLPTLNGFEALRRVRRQSLLPILILSAGGNDTERVMALELGADDYLHKPFLLPELSARLRTILRRASTGVSVFGTLVKAKSLELNRNDYRVKCREREIPLTASEFDLLEYLVKRAGQIISREELTQQILRRELNSNDRSIDVHISNLRKKLATNHIESCKIKAIRGVGYMLILI